MDEGEEEEQVTKRGPELLRDKIAKIICGSKDSVAFPIAQSMAEDILVLIDETIAILTEDGARWKERAERAEQVLAVVKEYRDAKKKAERVPFQVSAKTISTNEAARISDFYRSRVRMLLTALEKWERKS